MSLHRNKIRKAALAASVALAATLAGCANNPADNANATDVSNSQRPSVNAAPAPEVEKNAPVESKSEPKNCVSSESDATEQGTPSAVTHNTVGTRTEVRNFTARAAHPTVTPQARGHVTPTPAGEQNPTVPADTNGGNNTTTPVTPSEPSTPSGPSTPATPSTPSEPATPSEPSTPATPSEPPTPSEPSTPETPNPTPNPNDPLTVAEARARVAAAEAVLTEAKANFGVKDEAYKAAKEAYEAAVAKQEALDVKTEDARKNLVLVRANSDYTVQEAKEARDIAAKNLAEARTAGFNHAKMVAEAKQAVADAQREVNDAEKAHANAQEALKQAKAAYDTASREEKKLAEKIDALKGELATASADKAAVSAEIAQLEKEREKLNSVPDSASTVNWDKMTDAEKEKAMAGIMFEWVNEYRRQAGFTTPLLWSNDMASKSSAWSGEMAKDFPAKKDIDHSVKGSEYRNAYDGENITMFGGSLFEYEKDAWQNLAIRAMENFQHSQGHNRNLLYPGADIVGIGVKIVKGDPTFGEYSVYVTYQFGFSKNHNDARTVGDVSKGVGFDVKSSVHLKPKLGGTVQYSELGEKDKAAADAVTKNFNDNYAQNKKGDLLAEAGLTTQNQRDDAKIAELDKQIADKTAQLNGATEREANAQRDLGSATREHDGAVEELKNRTNEANEAETSAASVSNALDNARTKLNNAVENQNKVENTPTVSEEQLEGKLAEAETHVKDVEATTAEANRTAEEALATAENEANAHRTDVVAPAKDKADKAETERNAAATAVETAQGEYDSAVSNLEDVSD